MLLTIEQMKGMIDTLKYSNISISDQSLPYLYAFIHDNINI